jgi:hypothetical protein
MANTRQRTALSSHLATPAESPGATGRLYSQVADHVR